MDVSHFKTKPTLRHGVHHDYILFGFIRAVLGIELRTEAFKQFMLVLRASTPLCMPGLCGHSWISKKWCKILSDFQRYQNHEKHLTNNNCISNYQSLWYGQSWYGKATLAVSRLHLYSNHNRSKTCWPEEIPIRNITSLMVTNYFVNKCVLSFGVPKRVITYQDRKFNFRWSII